MLLFATIMKALDGISVKVAGIDGMAGWGVLLLWRDGFLLALGITGTMLLMHYKGAQYKWLRTTMLCAIPLLFYTLIISYRRTFFLALLVSAFAMLMTVGKGRRKQHMKLLLYLILALAVFILFTDPLGFMARLFGVLQPKEEGSAYIRLLEYPNVIRNIEDNPIWGTAIGTQWHQYYRMPLFANFTTLGCHNTYLYWPLRAGILGSIGFLWLLGRIWKSLLINWRLRKTEEDFLITQISIHIMIIYNVASFFGLMYSDAMTSMTGIFLALFQLQMTKASGLTSYAKVSLFRTLKEGTIVYKGQDRLLEIARK
jgi:O-antigen ligase